MLRKRQDSRSKDRSESAPLQKRKSVPNALGKSFNNDCNSSRLNNTTLNESMNKKSSSSKSKDRKLKSKTKRREVNLENSIKISTNGFEMELLQIFLNN